MYTENERIESALRLRQVRESANLSQEEFAEILGISVSAYKKVERGENHVSLACLKKLYVAMNVSTDYILYGDKEKLEDTWRMILNCSEQDKMFLFLKLLSYFTKSKSFVFPSPNSQLQDEKDIMQCLRKLQGIGEE
jgi:transcriptional regulator with XRE-family HTH domain